VKITVKITAGEILYFIYITITVLCVDQYTGCTKKMSSCLASYFERKNKNKGLKPSSSFGRKINLKFGISYFKFGLVVQKLLAKV